MFWSICYAVIFITINSLMFSWLISICTLSLRVEWPRKRGWCWTCVGLGRGLRGGGLGRGLAHSGLPKIAKSKIINFLRGAGRTRVETRLEWWPERSQMRPEETLHHRVHGSLGHPRICSSVIHFFAALIHFCCRIQIYYALLRWDPVTRLTSIC